MRVFWKTFCTVITFIDCLNLLSAIFGHFSAPRSVAHISLQVTRGSRHKRCTIQVRIGAFTNHAGIQRTLKRAIQSLSANLLISLIILFPWIIVLRERDFLVRNDKSLIKFHTVHIPYAPDKQWIVDIIAFTPGTFLVSRCLLRMS